MNNRLILLFLITILCNYPMADIATQTKKNVKIGVVYDGRVDGTDELFDGLKNELTTLLGSKYNIHFPDDKILDADWSAANADAHYDCLVQNRDVDIIIGLGMLTGTAIAKRGNYTKPVIALGIFEPELQGLPPATENKSGIRNLTYILINRSVERDLDIFYEIFPYQRVGIVFYGELLKFLSADPNLFREVMEKNKTSFELLPMTDKIEEILTRPSKDIDALYLGYAGRLAGEGETKLIDEINARGIPSFSSSVANVKRGVLAAIGPEENFPKIIRRISLHVEAILNGEDPANLPVNMSFEENLMLNMQTANKIGFSPKFTVLAKAELINEFSLEGARVVNLPDVMHEAINANLDLKIEEGSVNSAQKDVSLARTNFFPALRLGAAGLQIDKDRAEASFGLQPERTVTGTVAVEQLVFSEQAIGNVSIQQHLLRASEYSYEQLQLDVILVAAIAYFKVLRAKTGHKIQKDNVDLTKRNLEIAKQREAVGYSGRSDVYRWESRLATANTDLLAAKNGVELAKIRLNQLLNRPINEAFIAQETTLSDSFYLSYLGSVRAYLDTPRSLNIYTDFLVEEAIRNSPEIRQVDANTYALERSRRSSKLERFVPTIGLGLESEHVFYRNGAGSHVEGVDPIDNPWSVSLNASLPLFRGGATSVILQQTSIDITKLKDQRARLVQNLELNVRAAMLELIVKRVNLESSQKSAEFADKSLALVQDEYAQGRVSVVDLVDAQNVALSANLGALDSEYEFFISVLTTERAVGKFSLLNTSEEQQDFLNRFEAYFNERTR